jgi:hypothetical protein
VPIGDCGARSKSTGGVGYRAALGGDVHVASWLKLGIATSYSRTNQACLGTESDLTRTPTPDRDTPLVLAALGIDGAITLLGP